MLIANLKYILAFVYIHLSRNITKIKSNKQNFSDLKTNIEDSESNYIQLKTTNVWMQGTNSPLILPPRQVILDEG